MEALKKKLIPKVLELRVENNRTVDVPDFDVSKFLESLKKKKTKLGEVVKKMPPPPDTDLMETAPCGLYTGKMAYRGVYVNGDVSSVVAEALKSKKVYVLSPRIAYLKNKLKGDFIFSPFDCKVESFDDSAVIIDEVQLFKHKKTYETILESKCRVFAVSSTPGNLWRVFNMVRGKVNVFKVKGDWSEVADTVLWHKDVKDGTLLVRNPDGFVNKVENGKVTKLVRSKTFLNDEEFREKADATVESLTPFSEKGTLTLKQIAGLVVFSETPKKKKMVVHLVKGSKTDAVVEMLKRKSLVSTAGFKDFKLDLENTWTYADNEEGEKSRAAFNKAKSGVLLMNDVVSVDVAATEVHMAGLENYDTLLTCCPNATPHVYVASNTEAVVGEGDVKKETVDEKRFHSFHSVGIDVLMDASNECIVHGIKL